MLHGHHCPVRLFSYNKNKVSICEYVTLAGFEAFALVLTNPTLYAPLFNIAHNCKLEKHSVHYPPPILDFRIYKVDKGKHNDMFV